MTSLAPDPPCQAGEQRDGDWCALVLDHEIDLALCVELEQLANGLPKLPPGPSLRATVERIVHAGERWSDLRWRALFDAGQAWESRIADSFHAEDVAEALWHHWRDPSDASAGQLSYMLRALFDGRRRSIALEEALLGCAGCQSSASD